MGNQTEHHYLDAEAGRWPAAVMPSGSPDAGPDVPCAGKIPITREFAELVVATARALRATHVVTNTGWVVYDAGLIPAVAVATPPQLVVEAEYLRATQPQLDMELAAALRRSDVEDCQCVGQANFNSLITLKRIDFGRTRLVFVRTEAANGMSDRELLPLARAFNLTRTEIAVLRLLGCGLSPEMVAERLEVAISTVRSHIKNLLEKTSCQDLRRLLIHVCRTVG